MKFKMVRIIAVLLLGTALCIDQTLIGWASRSDLLKAREEKKQIQQKMIQKSDKSQLYHQKIDAVKKKIAEIEIEKAPLEAEYLKAQKRLDELDIEFKKSICRYYKNGETSYLEKLLSAPSIQEFLQRLMVIRLITKHDYKLVEQRRQILEEVAERKSVYDDRINEQQKYIEEGQKAYLELQKDIDHDRADLKHVQCIEEEHEEELIQINLEEWKSGKLRFPFSCRLSYPTKGTRQTSGYGTRSLGRSTSFHAGIDYAGPLGTPIYAAADGVVVSVKASSGYGSLITIYHGELNGKSVFTRYAHSYFNQIRARVGQQVYGGETQISSVGNLGHSTGPHLHFEILYGNGDNPPSSNPQKWFQRWLR